MVEDERAWLERARREVESQGKRMLLQGLELLVRLQMLLWLLQNIRCFTKDDFQKEKMRLLHVPITVALQEVSYLSIGKFTACPVN